MACESSDVSPHDHRQHDTEWGALAGVFSFDEVTVNYLRSRVGEFANPKRPGETRSEESLRLHQD